MRRPSKFEAVFILLMVGVFAALPEIIIPAIAAVLVFWLWREL